MMRVKIEYMNKDLEVTGFDIFDFDLYCKKLSQDALGIIGDVEKSFIENNIDCDNDDSFKVLRRRLLNLAGALQRIPNNMMPDAVYGKATKENILNVLKGG